MDISINPDSEPEISIKGCNCRYSKCLKLYCECFAAGEYCVDCNCNNCCNNFEHEETRNLKIQAILERDPLAFRPKIPKVGENMVVQAASHFKGCNCKRTKCSKKYCECFNAGISCTTNCKCANCRNNKIEVDNKDKHHPDEIDQYCKFLAEPLIKKKGSNEEIKSEEDTSNSEEGVLKTKEELGYEKFEEFFYARLLMLLSNLS